MGALRLYRIHPLLNGSRTLLTHLIQILLLFLPFRERFSKELEQAIHGTVRASPDEWGETLEGEQLRGGSFLEQDQIQVRICIEK